MRIFTHQHENFQETIEGEVSSVHTMRTLDIFQPSQGGPFHDRIQFYALREPTRFQLFRQVGIFNENGFWYCGKPDRTRRRANWSILNVQFQKGISKSAQGVLFLALEQFQYWPGEWGQIDDRILGLIAHITLGLHL